MAINIPEFGVQILLRIFWRLMVLNPVLFRLKLWKKMVMVEYTNIVQMHRQVLGDTLMHACISVSPNT